MMQKNRAWKEWIKRRRTRKYARYLFSTDRFYMKWDELDDERFIIDNDIFEIGHSGASRKSIGSQKKWHSCLEMPLYEKEYIPISEIDFVNGL